MIRDSLGQRQEVQDAHGGRGSALIYAFFKGKTDPSIRFCDLVLAPGACAGYHRHEETEEIVYILSGQMEAFQEAVGVCWGLEMQS